MNQNDKLAKCVELCKKKLHSTVTTVSRVTLCWYQREQDQVRHLIPSVSPFLVLCAALVGGTLQPGEGSEV